MTLRERLVEAIAGRGDIELAAPASSESVAALEARIGVELPEDYRTFLVEVADGMQVDDEPRLYGLKAVLEDLRDGDPSRPFPYDDAATAKLRDVMATVPPGSTWIESRAFMGLQKRTTWGDGCITIASNGGNDFSLLVLTGSQRGVVWRGGVFRTPLTLDRPNRMLTFGVGALVAAVVAVVAATGSKAGIVALGITVGALAVSWAMSPRALAVEGDEIVIERRLWPSLRFARCDVVSAGPLDSVGRKAARLFGVGGFFGSYGLFWSDKLGKFRLYATHAGQAVVVKRKEGLLPIVITADDVAGAIDAIDPRVRVADAV
jgi:hypothetical protein